MYSGSYSGAKRERHVSVLSNIYKLSNKYTMFTPGLAIST
jgi:hypothetical protein